MGSNIDIQDFAENAIDTAGELGERKRKFATESADALAKSRMAELERTQLGETKRRGLIETGLKDRSIRSQTGETTRRRLAETGLESRSIRQYGPGSQQAREIGLRFGPGGIEEKRINQAGITARSKLVNMPAIDEAGFSKGYTTPGIGNLKTGMFEPFRASDDVVVRILRDPKTGDTVHLNEAGEEIKRVKGTKKKK